MARQIKGSQIIPDKNGKRVLVYPACGSDMSWIYFLSPDVFVGVDQLRLEGNPFNVAGHRMESILHGNKDAAVFTPEIPNADEVVLLLKCFDWIGLTEKGPAGKLKSTHPQETRESWEKYQQNNLTAMGRYLDKCEESSSKRTFVIDFDGYEQVMASRNYRQLLSVTPTASCYSENCEAFDSKRCEKAWPLTDWNDVLRAERGRPPGYQRSCSGEEKITIMDDRWDRVYLPGLSLLVTYLKEK